MEKIKTTQDVLDEQLAAAESAYDAAYRKVVALEAAQVQRETARKEVHSRLQDIGVEIGKLPDALARAHEEAFEYLEIFQDRLRRLNEILNPETVDTTWTDGVLADSQFEQEFETDEPNA